MPGPQQTLSRRPVARRAAARYPALHGWLEAQLRLARRAPPAARLRQLVALAALAGAAPSAQAFDETRDTGFRGSLPTRPAVVNKEQALAILRQLLREQGFGLKEVEREVFEGDGTSRLVEVWARDDGWVEPLVMFKVAPNRGALQELSEDPQTVLDGLACLVVAQEDSCDLALCDPVGDTAFDEQALCGGLLLLPAGILRSTEDPERVYEEALAVFMDWLDRAVATEDMRTGGCTCDASMAHAPRNWLALLAGLAALAAARRRRAPQDGDPAL